MLEPDQVFMQDLTPGTKLVARDRNTGATVMEGEFVSQRRGNDNRTIVKIKQPDGTEVEQHAYKLGLTPTDLPVRTYKL